MFADMKKHVRNWKDEEEVGTYLRKLLHKEAFDKRGLIYGMGMRCILFPIPVQRSSSVLWRSWRMKRAGIRNSVCTVW